EIIRHTKVKGTASPYDGNLIYWSKRLRKSPDVSTRVINLLRKQEGKCELCGLTFKDGDKWEVDQIIPTTKGGKDWYINLQLLHDYCHDYKTARDGSKGRIHDKDDETEEPDEMKVSRPVLKTSRGGDPLA
ncbi:MAG: HNH endonuclease, partial [Hormoscilla sp. GM102CHS1]|nr:HNH endonuclease [Hormoscilla sp. GM102CHS1]